MSLLYITKLKTWMFLSYKCHSLIQDIVFHILTHTAPSNVTWECLFCSVCAFQLLTYYAMIKCEHIFTPCSFATAITYNTDNVSHQTSLNRSSGTIPLSPPYIWLHTVYCVHEPRDYFHVRLAQFEGPLETSCRVRFNYFD